MGNGTWHRLVKTKTFSGESMFLSMVLTMDSFSEIERFIAKCSNISALIIIGEEETHKINKSKSVEVVRNPDGSLSFPNGLVLNEWKTFKADFSSTAKIKFLTTMIVKWFGVDHLPSPQTDKLKSALNKANYAFRKLLANCRATGGKFIPTKILFTFLPMECYMEENIKSEPEEEENQEDYLRKDGKGLLKRKRRKRKEEEENRRLKKLQKIKEEEMSESDYVVSDDEHKTKQGTNTYGAFDFPTDESLRSSFTIFGQIFHDHM